MYFVSFRQKTRKRPLSVMQVLRITIIITVTNKFRNTRLNFPENPSTQAVIIQNFITSYCLKEKASREWVKEGDHIHNSVSILFRRIYIILNKLTLTFYPHLIIIHN